MAIANKARAMSPNTGQKPLLCWAFSIKEIAKLHAPDAVQSVVEQHGVKNDAENYVGC